jgi:hypothetical protein
MDTFPDKIIYMNEKSDVNYMEKRQNSFVKTIDTLSFQINFKCDHPYGETNFNQGKCYEYLETFTYACSIIENSLFLKERVVIDAQFQSFCSTPFNSKKGTECAAEDKSLGRAAPAYMHLFNETFAKKIGMDAR